VAVGEVLDTNSDVTVLPWNFKPRPFSSNSPLSEPSGMLFALNPNEVVDGLPR